MNTTARGFTSDVTYGFRQIRKNLSLTLLCIAVLAIGIGATTAVFAVLYDVLLKPLPYREANRLVYVHNEFPSSQLGHANVSAPDYANLTGHHDIFSETAAYYFNDFTLSSVSGSGYAQHVDAVNASASLFSILGIPPQLGRTILTGDEEGRRQEARWWIAGLLAAALFINYVDRGAVPTAAPLIQSELGLSASQLGVLFSAFFWSYALLQLPVGWLAERYGAHRVLAIGLTVWACATMLVGLAHSFVVLLGLRLLLGIGESAGFPCLSNLLATVMPVKSLGRANGIVACGYLFGPAVGAYCGGLIMAHYGWRATFWVFGGLSLLWLLPWSRVRLPQRAVQTSADDAPTLGVLLRQPSLWGTSLGLFSSNYTFYFMLN